MKLHLFFLFLSLIAPSSFSLPLERGEGEISFGSKSFSIKIDAKNGAFTGLVSDGAAIMGGASGSVIDLKLENGKTLRESGAAFVLNRAEKVADDVLETEVGVGELSIIARYQLFPEKRLLKRSFRISTFSTEALKIYGFIAGYPRIDLTEGGGYTHPGAYPPFGFRTKSELCAGRKSRSMIDPYPAIVQKSQSASLVFAMDRSKPYSDRGATEVTEGTEGVFVSELTETAGYLKPGSIMEIGDFYCWLQKNGAEQALLRMHEWMSSIGMEVPADCPSWAKQSIIYSFHPGGTKNHPFKDWGGFARCLPQLPRIQALNCNTLWILPVEDYVPYIPDNYFAMQNGIGTAEEYKSLVDAAHGLGFRVLQDIVPHGGYSICDRAKEHPEQLLRNAKGETPRVRCFDFNNPAWISYMRGVAKHFLSNYPIDGFRIDACGGSFWQNWSDEIPYGRASFSQSQGGLAIQRAIRAETRLARADGMTLAECDQGSIYGTASDVTYDFDFCLKAFKSIRAMPPDVFVDKISRWLHEQQYAELKDLFRLRYVDSHDTLRAELLYGPLAMRAGVALSAWIHGVPMLYKEMEDGSSPVISRILRLRRETPELSFGDADYSSSKAQAGVFSCLRSFEGNVSVPVVNFNPEGVHAEISIPCSSLPKGANEASSCIDLWNDVSLQAKHEGDRLYIPVDLPAYGFTVLRFGSALRIPLENKFKAGGELPELEGFLLLPDGSRRDVSSALKGKGMVDLDLPDETALMLRVPINGQKCIWTARCASGVYQDAFRTRHPFYNSAFDNIYSLPQGVNVLWSSVRSPFGLTENEAEISLETGTSSICFQFQPERRPAAVFLLDRVGDDLNPWLFVMKRLPDTPLAIEGSSVAFKISKTPSSELFSGTGDARLFPIAGGWLFDNGSIRMRIGATGALAGWWKKSPDGSWVQLLSDAQLVMESGYTDASERYATENDAEAFSLFHKETDGSLTLRFFGRPRGNTFFDKLAPNLLNYAIAYTLNDSDSFGFTCAARPVSPPMKDKLLMALSLRTVGANKLFFFRDGALIAKKRFYSVRDGVESKLPQEMRIAFDAHKWNVSIVDIVSSGPKVERISLANDEILYAWNKKTIPAGDFGIWRVFSAKIGVGDLQTAPFPCRDMHDRKASDADGHLLDPSFEFDYWGAFPETVQMFSYALPWQMPIGAQIASDFPHSGKRAAKITLAKNEVRVLRQPLPVKLMRKGETWRVTAFVKGELLEPVNTEEPAAIMRLSNPNAQKDPRAPQKTGRYIATSLPTGSFDYAKFQVDFRLPEKFDGAEVQIGGLEASGTLWVDDVSLTKLSEAIE